MFGSLGAPELIIIALVIVLIFGVGKISGLGRELGTSIKEFRRAVKDEDEETRKAAQQVQQTPYQQSVQAPPPPPVAAQPPASPQNSDPNNRNTPNLF